MSNLVIGSCLRLKLNLRELQKDVQVVRLFGHTIKVSPNGPNKHTKQERQSHGRETLMTFQKGDGN